ncbi:MAG TPA: glycosyltransferase family A protein [Candidatus Dormibacteraeota bacterium]|nr:glycosyltransferase family A protein [Candidatus Dormibacteraeota bacterium]
MQKISVIVPVYNGEKYIKHCLDSILNQSFEYVEVLAINDGSKDNSLKILREYERTNPERIKVFTQRNGGVAEARNRGIELAKTKYLMFIDQDDFIDPDYCETFYSAAEEGGYDVVLGGFKRPNVGRRIINRYVRLKNTPYAKYVCTSLFAKIHKTSFVKANKISVLNTMYGEDTVFILREYAKTDSIKVIENYAGYNWFYNEKSVSNTSQKSILDMLQPHLALLQKAKKYDTNNSPEYEYYILQTIVFYLLWGGRSARISDFMHAHGEVFKWLNVNYPNFQNNKYLLFGPCGAPGLNRLSISIFLFMHKLHLVRLFANIYCKGA